jgi:uncharacterized membrane protein (DUF4010 family)
MAAIVENTRIMFGSCGFTQVSFWGKRPSARAVKGEMLARVAKNRRLDADSAFAPAASLLVAFNLAELMRYAMKIKVVGCHTEAG